jgi:hypothetical protein
MYQLPTFTILQTLSPHAVPHEDDPESEVWYDYAGELRAVGHTIDGEPWIHVLGVATYHLAANHTVITAYPHKNANPNDIVDRYHRNTLPLALQLQGLSVLHASSVQNEHGVIGLCAYSMTGKSTLAYGLQERGYRLWGDDALVLVPGKAQTMSLPLPFRMRLREASAHHYQLSLAEAAPRWEGPTAYQDCPDPAPLRALFILERSQEQASIIESACLKATEAYTALFDHLFMVNFIDEALRRKTLQTYLQLVAVVPVFRITFRAGLEHLPQLFDTIAQLSSPLPARTV